MAAVHAKPALVEPPLRRRGFVWRYLAVAGPGLIVAFAGTEAGSVTTAATSGAQFGMKLVLLQVLLIVPLFVVQEMTVRLGTVSGKGHAQLIRERYGLGWAWVSLGTMLVTNMAALVTEFIGIAGAALVFGLPVAPMVLAAAALLIAIVFSGKYRRAEYAALALCLLELLFVPAAFAAHPSAASVINEGLFGAQPLGDRDYLLLVAGNIGAVIMPWMIFYQQSATVDKGLKVQNLSFARVDTAIGSVLTQVIMIAIVVTAASTLFVHGEKVEDAAHAALAIAWAFGEAFAWPCSLNYNCTQAKRFYGLYAAMVIVSAAVVLVPHLPLVKITVYVEAFNALVLPIVLGFLLVLSNDKKVLGARVNSLLGNVIAIGISAVCIVLGIWYGFLTISGQTG